MNLRSTRSPTTRPVAFFAATALFGACGGGDEPGEEGEVTPPPETDDSGGTQAYMTGDPSSSSAETWVRSENVTVRQIPKEEFENKAVISIVAEN